MKKVYVAPSVEDIFLANNADIIMSSGEETDKPNSTISSVDMGDEMIENW